MRSSARENYLVTEVMTAAPQKLQLMLIEAAIRAAQRARQMWQAGRDDQACEALIHAQQLVAELLAGLNRDVDAALVGKMASVYLFIFRSLMEANQGRDEEKLDAAVRVLEVERATWRQVCEQLGSGKVSGEQAGPANAPAASPPAAADSAAAVDSPPERGLAGGPSGGPSSRPPDGRADSGISLEA